MSRKTQDPRALFDEARRQMADAERLEGEAIRAALEANDWIVSAAARALGLPKHTSLVQLLAGRHKAIGEELKRRREQRGYVRGNPAPMRSE